MMERHNGNMHPFKAGKPPYSVETPYGFRLDLDFLKYVDDIEKGNTIKRVFIQRRSKGPRANTLPRHLHPSGYRPSPWGSTGALGPRSRLPDDHHHAASWLRDYRKPVSPRGLAEMEAKIRDFDEQPLGEHIRPHLLRASSLPLTVLLRQGSESTEEPGSLRSSRDHLGGRNSSCEDIFDSSDIPQDCSSLWRRLTEALDHVEELEKEVQVIPDLRAQICLLQEEKDKLRSHIHTQSLNGTAAHYVAADKKRPRHGRCIMLAGNHGSVQEPHPTHEWRASTDLDELLTVTSLQAKVAVLEQKLHETELELQRVTGRLRHQQKEGRNQEEQIEHLIANPGVWVRAEKVLVDQEGEEMSVITNGETSKHEDDVLDSPERNQLPTRSSADTLDTSVVIHHIHKIKQLLDQQWECLSAAEEEKPAEQISPRVISVQQEMMELIDILTSHYTQSGHNCGSGIQHSGEECGMKTDGGTPDVAHERCQIRSSGDNPLGQSSVQHVALGGLQQEESSIRKPWEMAATQVDADPEKREMSRDKQMISQGIGSGWTDGGTASVEAVEMAKMKPLAPGEQMEGDPGSITTTGSETVNADFMAACHFLNDHMDNIENPTHDTRKALVVVFQDWFSAAAEESSLASRVAVYLREVKTTTPSLTAFIINLADDNGNTVLHYSVSHSHYSIVSLLLDTGVSDVNFQNKAGYTAAMLASLTTPDNPGDMEVVRRLMELGDINIRSSQTGHTALHLAVRHGRVVMVRLLLSCGADADIQDGQGTTALMFASERGHTHIARLLLERTQCDLSLADQSGRTALSIAMHGSHSDTAALLQAHAKARAL
uniref:KN motif and ankyrin repeat domain-containing protein 1-like n=1 Tax=Doryrhamphus excisus TaxID=161450 RepID=UPI0025AEC7B8|nr:KN motif and ankyrin repeat domain-containing protein 1-like [Doryrhamphus excisus]XP_057922392.1 KN motif and ankyrin repeat domain-containing protein 1-like [Doryrhamphus excisus]XP_057922393.1 KN motif and ankyrin repeat domain-containing protein 1-like [Doryrhamphus excisus]XP_057922394.1 KN motif and ankyrin repeat domain-containing protein 1-like [Doryrhamphus excisus]